MHKFFLPLFGSAAKTYAYRLPIEIVHSEIESVFVESRNFFGSIDIKGGFTGVNEFYMQSTRGMAGTTRHSGSILFGVIKPIDPEKTEIIIQTRATSHSKSLFWFIIILSLIILYQFLTTGSLLQTFGGLAMLAVGLFVAVKVAETSNVGVQERYYLFIHKRLKKKEGA